MRPSARLVRAVTAERADLERQRAHLAREAADLRAALTRIEQGMAEIDEQCGAARPPGAHRREAGGGRSEPGGRAPLRGPAIREVAVRLLVEEASTALHYREWFDLLTARGTTSRARTRWPCS